jgi:serine/threonine protein phosphatase PrpC
MSDPTEDTLEFVHAETFADDFFVPATPPLAIEFGAATHVGRVRSNNEDHYAVVRRNRSSEVLDTNLTTSDLTFTDDHAYILVVADGMGGANFGEFASGLALRTMFQLASQATSWVMKLSDFDRQQVPERVAAYVQRMQGALREYASRHPEFAGMGTTWTLAYLLPPHGIVVHVGDSRAYLFRDGQLRQITRDETMAQAFIDAGLEPDSVKKFGHILLNSFGGDKDQVSAQIHQIEVRPGDQLLLCTDGLSGMVPDDVIGQQLQRRAAPQAACDALVARALENGGKDNVTVVLAVAAATAS